MVYRIFSMCSTYEREKRPVCAFLTPKSDRVLKDMSSIRAECLLWSALGSGVAALPLLELEAKGERPWANGGMKDVEFIKRCEEHEIKVFAVPWEAQGYDKILMGAENGKITSWMERFGKGRGIRFGLDAFYKNEFPELGRWEDYFEGKFEKDGKEIESLVDASACRSIWGTKPWAIWILPHILGPFSTYAMCRNSPHWRRYLKRVVELQIDYGAHGIQIDESAMPWDCIWCGAGYCKYCGQAFLEHMGEKYGTEKLKAFGDPKEFNLRKFLHGRLVGPFRAHWLFKHFPFWKEYRVAQIKRISKTFSELVNHARGYGKKKGKEIEVTGNFAFLNPPYFPLAEHVDFITLELTFGTPLKSKHALFYKLGRSIGKGKQVTIVPSVNCARKLMGKRANTLLKAYCYEAFASQGNFMAPYSCYTISEQALLSPARAHSGGERVHSDAQGTAEGEQLVDVALVFSYASHLHEFSFIANPYFERVRRTADRLA